MTENTQENSDYTSLAAKESIAAAQTAHAELRETLNMLAKKLDYPSRIDAALSRGKAKLQKIRRNKPAVFTAAIAGASTVLGAAAAATIYAISKR